MSKILVEESALESIKAMPARLQTERDELLNVAGIAHRFLDDMPHAHMPGHRANAVRIALLVSIDRCTTTPKVME